jgi:choline dehydrogenase
MARAYRADRKDGAGDRRAWEDAKRDVKYVAASKEVILCGGAFNTPQLLMLSGIGPQPQLDAIHVPAVVVRPGVGANLQDRYEVGVIDDVAQEFEILKGYPFTGGAGDPGYVRWRDRREGLYTTNGGTVAILKRSRQSKTNDCDLFIFGIPGEFAGYELDYSKRVETPEGRSRFSWIILKAHTENFGNVTVTSPDPRDPPKINFKNFKDGADPNDRDLLALEEAVEFIRGFMAPLRARGTTRGEWLPGSDKTGPALREFIVNNAWGHHASCTCKIGRPDDPDAVLDSAFRVIGAPGGNLRVVDASAFPRIPGYFIVLPVYLIAEKASDVILAAHGARTVPS